MYDLSSSLAKIVLAHVNTTCYSNTILTSDELQHSIEKVLIEKGYKSLATTYRDYRTKRTQAREMKSHLMHLSCSCI